MGLKVYICNKKVENTGEDENYGGNRKTFFPFFAPEVKAEKAYIDGEGNNGIDVIQPIITCERGVFNK